MNFCNIKILRNATTQKAALQHVAAYSIVPTASIVPPRPVAPAESLRQG